VRAWTELEFTSAKVYGRTTERPPVRPQKSIVREMTTDCPKTFERARDDMSVPSSGVTDAE
jgi:hypothetical protein